MKPLEKTKGKRLSKKGGLEIFRGSPNPLGSTVRTNGINFAVFSKHATDVILIIYASGERTPIAEIPLDSQYNKTGDIWHVFIKGLYTMTRYGYIIERDPNDNPNVHRFCCGNVLADPYAKALSGSSDWGKLYKRRGDDTSDTPYNIRRSIVIEDDFDWGYDTQLNIPIKDSIIYEMHVRGFTVDKSSDANCPGTYNGVIEKIPYLKELGVTALELLPIMEFEEIDSDRIDPLTGRRLFNYWGYQPISFFAPKASYACDGRNGMQVREFKSMVKALHEAGIEVILDVVFNHTAEGNERGPSFSFKGIDNCIYYIVDPVTGDYHNYSGCGNTLNCNHPVVRNMILDCLRYWVTEMHVDGFRFDLASILGRGRDGSVLTDPPLLERIAADPILANTKLIAEAWDAAGLYQVGSFPNWGRWAEWNGKFRDDVRRFVRGEKGFAEAMMLRLIGSPDLYKVSGREPFHSINFITCHDGFTLNDLVSYDYKHNESNGEDNRDGANDNWSWNCGWEGDTEHYSVNMLRRRQMKNFAAILLLSHGVPMILAGDELMRTQRGNNNAYCQDNRISWINWDLLEENPDMFRFFRELIKFRKQHNVLRPERFHSEDISWHGVEVNKPDFSQHSRTIAMFIAGHDASGDIYIILNSYYDFLRFNLPAPTCWKKWHRLIDTNLESPCDIMDVGSEFYIEEQNHYVVAPRSVVVLLSK
ncbi:MAG: glycogen debranching protein GlgX [Nitrospirae bacterium]|nr:glycogen debranching protein GlgX [Nitrospirota bacterium]MBF0535241.1 glycogen debranching protein GlgX [Nitrospirota bacterium]MBF0615279.1 glycogen debranching protein GlgX [Nitrospirota bacterium]